MFDHHGVLLAWVLYLGGSMLYASYPGFDIRTGLQFVLFFFHVCTTRSLIYFYLFLINMDVGSQVFIVIIR